MKKLILIILCLVSHIGISQECSFKVQGTVLDFHNATVIESATVLIKNSKKYAITNSKGEFVISNLCKGEITLVISHISCKTIEKKINIKGNFSSKFLLEHHTEELEEITVKGSSNKNTKTAQEVVIKAAKIEQFSSGSLADITKTVAGVSSLNTGNNVVKPIIHGLHSSRVITMQNGVRMQDQEWGLEHAPTVDVNALQQISVVKGASALAYSGDAIGGAIVLKPAKVLKIDSLYGKTITTFDANNTGFSVSSSVTKTTEKGWYFNGQASYRRFGDSRAPDYVLSNTGLDFKAFSLQTGFKSFEESYNFYYSYVDNEIGVLSAAHIGGLDQFITSIQSQQPATIRDFTYRIRDPRQRVRHHLAKLEYEKRYSNLGRLTLQYDYQRNQREEFDRRRGEAKGVPSIDLLLQTHGLQTKFLFDSNKDRKYNVGIQMQYQDNFASPFTGVFRLIPDFERFDLGAFVTSEFTFENDLFL